MAPGGRHETKAASQMLARAVKTNTVFRGKNTPYKHTARAANSTTDTRDPTTRIQRCPSQQKAWFGRRLLPPSILELGTGARLNQRYSNTRVVAAYGGGLQPRARDKADDATVRSANVGERVE